MQARRSKIMVAKLRLMFALCMPGALTIDNKHGIVLYYLCSITVIMLRIHGMLNFMIGAATSSLATPNEGVVSCSLVPRRLRIRRAGNEAVSVRIRLVFPTFLCSSLWPHSVLSDAVGVSVGRVRGRVERMDPALVGKEEEPSALEGKRQE